MSHIHILLITLLNVLDDKYNNFNYPKPLFFGPCQKSNPENTKIEVLIYTRLILNWSMANSELTMGLG